jgi:hypothetical protein
MPVAALGETCKGGCGLDKSANLGGESSCKSFDIVKWCQANATHVFDRHVLN